MPEGTLTLNIQTLEGALGGVTGLLGEPPAGGGPGSGLAGAAGLLDTPPSELAATFGEALAGQLAGAFQFEAAGGIAELSALFAQLRTIAEGSPTDALDGFSEQIAQAGAVFGGDLVGRIETTLEAVRGISNGVPSDRTAIVAALLDQVLAILGSLQGPEAEKIQTWIQSIRELHEILMPVVEQARTAPDPSAVAVQVVERALSSTLEVFGFDQVTRLAGVLDGLLNEPLPSALREGLTAALGAATSAYGNLAAAASGTYDEFRAAVEVAFAAMVQLSAFIRRVLGAIRRVVSARILQPGALEAYLRERIERALAVQVQDVQQIDDPFKALFDRIDAAIADVDLSRVRTEVLGFFEQVRDTIESVDIPSIGTFLQQQVALLEQAIDALQVAVSGLLDGARAFLGDANERARSLAEGVGQFDADGAFHFVFEQDLRSALTSARKAVEGDPDAPGAPSLAGSLAGFQSQVDGLFTQLDGVLRPAEEAVEGAVTAAVDGVETFTAFLEGLDVPALIEQLRQKVQEIVDALVPIDFDVIVDPIVTELDANAEKLRAIDTESLNSLLRAALEVALDVVISIDFSVEISAPLDEQFAAIRAVPEEAIQSLQQRYEQSLAVLDTLSPAGLLEALFAAFDRIDAAIGTLDVAGLMAPLDELHTRLLAEPLAALRPSDLLQPVAAGYGEVTGALDGLDPAATLAPLTSALDAFKATVADFDMTGRLDEVIGAVETVIQDLREVRPSELLDPLVADFARLESELDRFKPSVVFAPAAELAGPLLELLETIQEQAIAALHGLFQAPLALLDQFQPAALEQRIGQQLDGVVAVVGSLRLAQNYAQLKGQYFDLNASLSVGSGEDAPLRLSLAGQINPDRHLREIMDEATSLQIALAALKENVRLPDLEALYGELRERLLAMLPPYARQLLDVETFKRLMRLADPTRFLQALDERFDALIARLIPIRPADIAAELDATYESVLALVDTLDISDALHEVGAAFERAKGVAQTIRIDFLAAELDEALGTLRALVEALDPGRFLPDLDAVHAAVGAVVASTRPSQVLAGLQAALARVQALIAALDPRVVLAPPLEAAWDSVQGVLDEVDFTVVLAPILDKLDALEASLKVGLTRTETAFDGMLGAGRAALSGSGAATAGISL